MGDINIRSTYNLTLSSKGSRPRINIGTITSRLILDDLGDGVTENQILIKKTINSYKKLLFQVKRNSNVMVDVTLDVCDRKEAPGGLYWTAEIDGSTYLIRAGTEGFFEGKWLCLKNGQVIAYTAEGVSVNPWDAEWNPHGECSEATSVECSKSPALVWSVVPLEDIVGDIEPGSGGGGSIDWKTV
jgi:hypothetical protein